MRWKQFFTPVQSMNSEEAKEFIAGLRIAAQMNAVKKL
jgi:hypothetical protein